MTWMLGQSAPSVCLWMIQNWKGVARQIDQIAVLPFGETWTGWGFRLRGISWSSTRENAKSCIWGGIPQTWVLLGSLPAGKQFCREGSWDPVGCHEICALISSEIMPTFNAKYYIQGSIIISFWVPTLLLKKKILIYMYINMKHLLLINWNYILTDIASPNGMSSVKKIIYIYKKIKTTSFHP